MNFLEPRSTNYTKYILATVAVLFVVGTTGTSLYFYKKYDGAKKVDAKLAKADAQTTVSQVGKLIVLPSDEEPTVATVTDPSKLKSQAFFARAKVGDKVLLYVKAKKAILYDPAANKLVEVAPLNLDDANAPSVSGGTTAEAKP